MGPKKENMTIVPTKPHRPIGQQDEENNPPKEGKKRWNNIIEEWVDGAKKQDARRKRKPSEE